MCEGWDLSPEDLYSQNHTLTRATHTNDSTGPMFLCVLDYTCRRFLCFRVLYICSRRGLSRHPLLTQTSADLERRVNIRRGSGIYR